MPQAVEELRRCAGTQFDPRIVQAFVRTDARFRTLFGEGGLIAAAGNRPVSSAAAYDLSCSERVRSPALS